MFLYKRVLIHFSLQMVNSRGRGSFFYSSFKICHNSHRETLEDGMMDFASCSVNAFCFLTRSFHKIRTCIIIIDTRLRPIYSSSHFGSSPAVIRSSSLTCRSRSCPRIHRDLSRISSIPAILLISDDIADTLDGDPHVLSSMLTADLSSSWNRFSRASHRAASSLVFARSRQIACG